MHLRRPHNLSLAEARNRADRAIAALASELGLRCTWQGDTLHFNGNGVTGSLDVTADAVILDAQFSGLLRVLEPTLRSKAERKLDETLA